MFTTFDFIHYIVFSVYLSQNNCYYLLWQIETMYPLPLFRHTVPNALQLFRDSPYINSLLPINCFLRLLNRNEVGKRARRQIQNQKIFEAESKKKAGDSPNFHLGHQSTTYYDSHTPIKMKDSTPLHAKFSWIFYHTFDILIHLYDILY